MRSYLPDVEVANRVREVPAAGTSAGTVAVRAADLRVHGKTVTAAGRVPSAGEETGILMPAHRGLGVGV